MLVIGIYPLTWLVVEFCDVANRRLFHTTFLGQPWETTVLRRKYSAMVLINGLAHGLSKSILKKPHRQINNNKKKNSLQVDFKKKEKERKKELQGSDTINRNAHYGCIHSYCMGLTAVAYRWEAWNVLFIQQIKTSAWIHLNEQLKS